jgi:hypothetical protein
VEVVWFSSIPPLSPLLSSSLSSVFWPPLLLLCCLYSVSRPPLFVSCFLPSTARPTSSSIDIDCHQMSGALPILWLSTYAVQPIAPYRRRWPLDIRSCVHPIAYNRTHAARPCRRRRPPESPATRLSYGGSGSKSGPSKPICQADLDRKVALAQAGSRDGK